MTRQIVPAYVEIGKGNWVRVGQAAVDISMGSADITLDDDAPVADALKAMMSSRTDLGISIGFGESEFDIDRNEHRFIREVLPMDIVEEPKPQKPFVFEGTQELVESLQKLREIVKTDNDAPEMTTGRIIDRNVKIEFKDNLYTPRPGSPYGLSDEQLVAQMRNANAARRGRMFG